jgi:hypothetical protein
MYHLCCETAWYLNGPSPFYRGIKLAPKEKRLSLYQPWLSVHLFDPNDASTQTQCSMNDADRWLLWNASRAARLVRDFNGP